MTDAGFPFALKYERKIRDEDPADCEYCHRVAVYTVAVGSVEDGLGWKGDRVCDLHLDAHHYDADVVGTARQLGAKAGGRWGDDYE